MFKRLIAWLTGKAPDATAGLKIDRTRRAGLGLINADKLTTEARAVMPDVLAEHSNIPQFKGKVNHVYDLATIDNTEQCPRCGSPTRQHYANWVYATDRAPRSMTAPAGYFCGKCPTVIVDQDMLKAGTTKGYRYVQVIGLTDNQNKGFQPFDTWNGEKSIYVFDENQQPMGINSLNDLTPEERRLVKRQNDTTRRKRWKVKRK